MALWHQCGSGFVKVSFASRDLGADAYLCCPGPSLANVDPASLNVPGAFVVALNTAYPYIRPHLWIGMDRPGCYDRRLWWEGFPKIVRGTYKDEYCGDTPIQQCPLTYFADATPGEAADIFKRRAHDTAFVWANNSFVLALHVLVWMGARKIYLVGSDFGGPSDYHDGRKLPPQARQRNRRLYGQLVGTTERIAELGRSNYVEITSCTVGSPVNDRIGFTPLAEALAASASRVPPGLDEPLNAHQEELCRWCCRTPAGRGVLTACDNNGEWMLPWWWEHYSAHNTLPVAFADLGMTDDARRWCAERGIVIEVERPADVKGWYLKPFAILASPFESTLWLDTDCEVRGDVSPVYDYAGEIPGLCRDFTYEKRRGRGLMPGERLYMSGLVAVKHGSQLIREWARATLLRWSQHDGDGPILNSVIRSAGVNPPVVPPKYHHARCEGDDAKVLIMHWSGPPGKAHIREAIQHQESGSADATSPCRQPDAPGRHDESIPESGYSEAEWVAADGKAENDDADKRHYERPSSPVG